MSPPGIDLFDKPNINELDFWSIVEGLRCWYPEFKGKSVTVFMDNTQVMYMLRKGINTNSACMNWLRAIFWICKIVDNRIEAKYANNKIDLVWYTLSRILYVKSVDKACRCLRGSMLCCIENVFTFCRTRTGQTGKSV